MAPTPVAQPAAAPNEPFAYRRIAIDSSRPEAEACLAFNKPLATGDVKYADYVRISPEVKSALRVVTTDSASAASPTARITRCGCWRVSRAATAPSSMTK